MKETDLWRNSRWGGSVGSCSSESDISWQVLWGFMDRLEERCCFPLTSWPVPTSLYPRPHQVPSGSSWMERWVSVSPDRGPLRLGKCQREQCGIVLPTPAVALASRIQPKLHLQVSFWDSPGLEGFFSPSPRTKNVLSWRCKAVFCYNTVSACCV